jgi:hypothetical protein
MNQTANSDIKIILGFLMQKLVNKMYLNPPLAMNVYLMKPTTDF